jgi:hypothetical protein
MEFSKKEEGFELEDAYKNEDSSHLSTPSKRLKPSSQSKETFKVKFEDVIYLQVTLKKPKPKESHYWVKTLHIQVDETIIVDYSLEEQNRIYQVLRPDDFLIVSFEWTMDPPLLRKILSDGIIIQDANDVEWTKSHYVFFSYSANQIKQRTCMMYRIKEGQSVDELLNTFGKFSKITNVSKKAARIGQLFSTCTPTIDIPKETKLEDDIEHGGTFTKRKSGNLRFFR